MGKLLQIGSGKNVGENWVNIDQITFPGVQTVNIDPNLNLPIGNHEVSVAYTSHFLEHLDDSTVARVLAESFRVLQDNGSLVIKIPDFSMIQAWYRENNWEQFQKFKFFGVTSVLERWKKYNVQPTYTNVASMMFCGYWSKSLNDHFKFGVQADTDGYHGPARIDENITREILLNFDLMTFRKNLLNFVNKIQILEPSIIKMPGLKQNSFLLQNHGDSGWFVINHRISVRNFQMLLRSLIICHRGACI